VPVPSSKNWFGWSSANGAAGRDDRLESMPSVSEYEESPLEIASEDD
jgi:hypothetical protein